MQIINNGSGLIVLIVTGIAFSWQIGLLGTLCFIVFLFIFYICAILVQKSEESAVAGDLSGEVGKLCGVYTFLLELRKLS